jgi:hypothetical protein
MLRSSSRLRRNGRITYARCPFAARGSRHFAFVIMLNHRISDVRFCLFLRDGVWASQVLKFRRAGGFKLFVRVLVGILSWETPSDLGMDVYQSNRHFFHCTSTWTYSQCNRRCVPGKAARIYKIKTALGPTKSEAESGQSLSDDAPTSLEQPTTWHNLRTRLVSARRYSCPDGPPPSLPRSAGTSDRHPSLLAQMGNWILIRPILLSGAAPHLVNSNSDSGNRYQA